MEIAEVRRRLLQRISRARKGAASRRAELDAAGKEYEHFLTHTAAPMFLQFAAALRAEGYAFHTTTPAGAVRLVSERSPDDFIEVELDVGGARPLVVGRSSYARGRRRLASERPVREGTSIAALTEEDVLDFLLAEVGPFVER